ncbi:thiamine phosphate synthase [Rufibacter tibetensis]|uniref:thiamine phosphate synthase n=1 Tax=Rufibacter tibetensis TaxID=512763 RepID=UPI000783CA6D|nr:thiamine phosphate synthase [Rufibacter tibetensis]
MPVPPFNLVVVTPDNSTPLQIALWLELLNAGADYLYVRGDVEAYEVQEELARLVSRGYASKLILPRTQAKSLEAAVRYFHVKERERHTSERTYSPTIPYSTSVHALSDIGDLDPVFQLVFYSPLFRSISKEGYGPKTELATIQKEWQALKAQQGRLPKVIGLGGISADNVLEVKQAGFDGAALLGAIWQQEDPVGAFRTVIGALQEK